MKLKFLGILLAMFLLVQAAVAAPFNANAKTKRIPAVIQNADYTEIVSIKGTS